MQNEIPVFFTIDDSYAPYLAVALCSAVQNASPARRYRAIVLHQDISEENQQKLRAFSKENFAIDLIPMQADLGALDDRMSNRLRCDYFTLTIYFRLFIPAMFPQYDKGIYIDSDVILHADIAELFDTDLEGCLLGGCPDLSIADTPPLVAYTENAVGIPKGSYINSGVLLMDLQKLRALDLEGHFLHLLTTYHFDCIAPDQDYINAICRGRIRYLDPAWNAMPNDKQPPLAAPKLVHYNLFAKPWCYDGIQYAELFWQYAKDSGYLETIRTAKAAYSDAQKAADSDCLRLLVQRGTEIQAQEITFKKLSAKGVKITL